MNGEIHVGRVRRIGCYCTQGALIYRPGLSYFPKKYRPRSVSDATWSLRMRTAIVSRAMCPAGLAA